MDRIDSSRPAVRKFGLLFAGICSLVGGYLLYAGSPAWKYLAGGVVFFLGTGLFGYPVLRPVYVIWMKFALILAWINTRILLGVFFYLIITPTGLLMRLFGKDFLSERIDRKAKSYWIPREQGTLGKSRYERMF